MLSLGRLSAVLSVTGFFLPGGKARSSAHLIAPPRLQSESITLKKDGRRARMPRREVRKGELSTGQERNLVVLIQIRVPAHSWKHQVNLRTLPPSFERAADDWYEAVKPHISERTKSIYGDALRLHLKPALGCLLLCDIDADRIASYQARRKAEKASARTLNKELQVLRMILKKYKLWANLQGDVKFEREQDEVGKALSREEEARLLEACASNPLLHTVVSLALNTALRKSEIRLLRWNQVDLFNRTLTVGKTKTEGGSGRLVPLNPLAHTALAKWAERFPKSKPEHYVFPSCEDARIDTANPDYSKVDP